MTHRDELIIVVDAPGHPSGSMEGESAWKCHLRYGSGDKEYVEAFSRNGVKAAVDFALDIYMRNHGEDQ